MSLMITEECINCSACEPECPNTAIYEGGKQWTLFGETYDPLAESIYYIVPFTKNRNAPPFAQSTAAFRTRTSLKRRKNFWRRKTASKPIKSNLGNDKRFQRRFKKRIAFFILLLSEKVAEHV
jgi:ferredoxin